MPAGHRPTASSTGSTVSVSWQANELPNGHNGYRVVRYDHSGIPIPATGKCSGVVTDTRCVESGVPDGVWRFSVRPILGTVWDGVESALSDPVMVTTVLVRFPKNGASYQQTGYRAGCGSQHEGDLCGSVAAGDGRTIFSLTGSLRHEGGRYWNPLSKAFDSDSEVSVALAGDASWFFPFAAENYLVAGKYTIRVQATDATGRAGTASSTFMVAWPTAQAATPLAPPTITPEFTGTLTNATQAGFRLAGAPPGAGYQCALDNGPLSDCGKEATIPVTGGNHRFSARVADPANGHTSESATFSWTVDTTAPVAVDLQVRNHRGTPGRVDGGDTLTYTFSEALRPDSILPGWSGTEAAAVTVKLGVATAAGGGDTLAVFAGGTTGRRLDALGVVNLGAPGYTTKEVPIEATLSVKDAKVVVTLGDPGGGVTPVLGTVSNPATANWCSGGGSDPAGNSLANVGTRVSESDSANPDVDF
jgi:hypothetical protein